MGRTVTNVDRTCGPTHLLVFSGNKICLNYKMDLELWDCLGRVKSYYCKIS